MAVVPPRVQPPVKSTTLTTKLTTFDVNLLCPHVHVQPPAPPTTASAKNGCIRDKNRVHSRPSNYGVPTLLRGRGPRSRAGRGCCAPACTAACKVQPNLSYLTFGLALEPFRTFRASITEILPESLEWTPCKVDSIARWWTVVPPRVQPPAKLSI